MRDGWKRNWGWRVGAVVLVGGLVLGASSVVTQAGERDDEHHRGNPFDRILHKLDKILDAIKGGGGQDGNHTLRWDTVRPAATRFVVLSDFAGAAVLDRETGLVWERAPANNGPRTWYQALDDCVRRKVSDRFGWHLPTIEQLTSLLDPSVISGLGLPPGHPFHVQEQEAYWSATTTATQGPAFAYGVLNRSVFVGDKGGTGNNRLVWCVRGGQSFDQQDLNTR